MQQQIQVGAGVVIKINGKVIGFATSLNFTRSQNLKTIYEVDNPMAVEIMPTTYSVSGSLTGFRLRDSGGLDGTTIQAMDLSTINSFFYQKYVVIEVVDRITSKTIYTFRSVLFDQDSWNITNKNIITFNANFRAIFVSNEAGDTQ
jgi:hypothetical protein